MSNSYNTFQKQAQTYLGITGTTSQLYATNLYLAQGITASNIYGTINGLDDTFSGYGISLTNSDNTLYLSKSTVEIENTLQVDDTINVESGGINVESGGINVVSGGLGITGTSVFYGEVKVHNYLLGLVPYYYVSVNNASDTYTSITSGYSIVYEMAANNYEYIYNGLSFYTGSGAQAAYFQPINAGIYMMTFMCRLKDGDNANNPSIEPYIYSSTSSPSSWVVSTTQASFAATNQSVSPSGLYLNYTQPIYVPTASNTRIDLRAYTTSGTLNISWGTFSLNYVSSL